MSDTTRLLAETAERLFADHATRATQDAMERGEFPHALWDAMAETGLTMAAAPEEAGGAGLGLEDVLALVRVAGAHALPAPLVETLLAQCLLASVGLEPPEGVLTIAPVLRSDAPGFAGGRLPGLARRVPWARHAAAVVVVAAGQVVLAGPPRVVALAANHANEPRDTVLLDETPVLASAPGTPPLREWGALFRANAMAGALQRCTAMSLTYARDRVQFGRPIAKFQAVQHQIALLASQAAAARVAAEAAARAAAAGPASFQVAAAKVRVGEAATQGAAIAHQVHGAMGFTHEHTLHHATRRLWSWREEFGNEAEWAARLGALVRQAGGAGLWPLVADFSASPG